MSTVKEIKDRWSKFNGDLLGDALDFTMEAEVEDQLRLLFRGPADVKVLLEKIEELEAIIKKS